MSFGLVAAAALVVLLSFAFLAVCGVSFVAVLSDEADTDTSDSSALLLSRGDSGRSAVVAMFCCDLTGDESMLVIDEDSLA